MLRKLKKMGKEFSKYFFLIIASAATKIDAGSIGQDEGEFLEIINKSPQDLLVVFENNNDVTSALIFHKYHKTKAFNINANEPLVIGVYKEGTKLKNPPPEKYSYDHKKFLGGNRANPQPDYIYHIDAPGKTKYLTWNPEKFRMALKYFYPQTGRFEGQLGKTKSGRSLANNIEQDDIKYVKHNRR